MRRMRFKAHRYGQSPGGKIALYEAKTPDGDFIYYRTSETHAETAWMAIGYYDDLWQASAVADEKQDWGTTWVEATRVKK